MDIPEDKRRTIQYPGKVSLGQHMREQFFEDSEVEDVTFEEAIEILDKPRNARKRHELD